MGKFLLDDLKKQRIYSEYFRAWRDREFSTISNEEQLLKSLEAFSQHFGIKEGMVIASYDYRDLSLAYFTENIEEIVGYPLSFFKKQGLQASLAMVHKDDINPLIKFQKIVHESFHRLERKEKETFEWSYTVRWVHKETKEEKWFSARAKPYLIDSNGNIVYDFHICVQLTSVPKTPEFDWSISYTNRQCNKVLITKNQPVKLEVKLTKKEKEIANFLLEGLDSQQIADKLFISRNTVFTHRKNLLKKLNAKNTGEMLKILSSNKLN